MGNKNMITNIYRIEAHNLINVQILLYCIYSIYIKTSLLHYKNWFFLKEFEKNDKILLKYFKLKGLR